MVTSSVNQQQMTYGQRTCGIDLNQGPHPGGPDGKESACSVRDLGSVPGLGNPPGGGNGYALQYSCLEISVGRGVWRLQSMELQGVGQD